MVRCARSQTCTAQLLPHAPTGLPPCRILTSDGFFLCFMLLSTTTVDGFHHLREHKDLEQEYMAKVHVRAVRRGDSRNGIVQAIFVYSSDLKSNLPGKKKLAV